MKLKFTRNENGEVVLLVDQEPFCTEHYLEMVKSVKEKVEIEVEDFGDDITHDEQESIKKMIKEINEIEFSEDQENEDVEDFDSIGNNGNESEDLPF